MKKIISSIVGTAIVSMAMIFSGCYTQLATMDEGSDQADASSYRSVESDTTVDTSSGTTVVNNYFGDDAYREWRFRSTFLFYSPSYAYGDGWYDPWGYEGYSYWDPWYGFALYPGIYWYGRNWYPPYWYFPSHAYYGYRGGYHDFRGFAYGDSRQPGRIRTDGPSRGSEGDRPRGTLGSPIGSVPASGVAARTRSQGEGRAASAVSPGAHRQRAETPWWVRLQNNQVANNATTSHGQQVTASQHSNVRQQSTRGRGAHTASSGGRRYVHGGQSHSSQRQGSTRTSSSPRSGGGGDRGNSSGHEGGGRRR